MRSVFLFSLLVSSGLVGCAGATSDSSSEFTTSSATAIVLVERTSGPADTARADTVTARFLRVRQGTVDESALRMAGVAEQVPAPGTCMTPSDGPSLLQGRAVELLDVGQVMLSSEGSKSTVMLPRAMPDPAGVLSGVHYSSMSRVAELFAAGSRVSLRSSGGADLAEGFQVSVDAPRELGDVRVTAVMGALDVAWEAREADAKDLVYVDIASSSQRVVSRCTAHELGHVLVPLSLANLDEALVAVHRVRKESFRAPGIEPGEVRFDVAKVVAYRR